MTLRSHHAVRIRRLAHWALGVVLAFMVLLMAVRALRGLLPEEHPAEVWVSAADSAALATFEAELQADSLRRVACYAHRGEAAPETFPFDPNRCDSATFVRLGLKPWMARNALKYRRAGGLWRSADDFRRLYGLSEADYLRLRPYIRISADVQAAAAPSAKSDSTIRRYPEKYADGVTLNANEADTTALKRIPGIGSYYAQKICRYRERLGGFVSAKQLREIDGLPADVERWFFVAPDATPAIINVNAADFKTLVRHPYLTYEQTREIVGFRQKHGLLRSWSDLSLSDHFTAADFERLAPYFTFR